MKKFLRFVLLAALLVPIGARAQVSLPINVGFEDSDTAAFNQWTTANCHESTGRSTNNFYDGSYCFSFRWTTNPPQYLISPEITPAEGTELVIFQYAAPGGSWDESFAVGFSSTTADTTAFTWKPVVVVPGGTDWTEYMDTLPAGTKYVAIKSTAYDAFYLYIDNLYIGAAPTCFRVQNIAASAITSDGMTIHWTDNLNTNASYTLSYWPAGALLPTDTTTVSNLSDTSYTISELESNSTYYFSVLPDCDESGIISPRTGSAKTQCAGGGCAILAYMTDAYDDSWNGNQIHIYQDSILMGTLALASGASGSTEAVQVCLGTPVTITYTKGNFASEMGGYIADAGGTVLFTIENMGDHNTGDILATTSNPCPSCLPPTGLTDSLTEEGNVVLTWRATEAGAYLVYAGDSLYTETPISDTSFTFTGLSASAVYQLGVANVCGSDEGDTSGIARRTVNTPCGDISAMPWSTGFEMDENGQIPTCWTVLDSTEGYEVTYPYVYDYSYYAHTGRKSLQMSAAYSDDTCFIVTSPFTYNPGNLHVKFWAEVDYYGGSFEVGMMTNPNDVSTFHVLKSIDQDYYNYTQFEFFTDTLGYEEGDTAYLAFRVVGDDESYGIEVAIDDISIRAIPNCRMPIASSGVIDSITYHGASFAWQGVSEDGYDVKLLHFTYNDSTGAVMDTIVEHFFADSAAIVLDSLLSDTYYQAYVATICEDEGEADTTDYISLGNFETLMRCYPVSKARLNTVTKNVASLSWNYPEDMGIASSSALLTLTDLSDTSVAPVVEVVNGTSKTYTGLVSGHSYSVTLSSLCGASDTAAARTIYFATHAPECAQYYTDAQADTYGSYAPMYGYYKYAYSQVVYNDTVLAGLDTLSGVAYNAYWYNEDNAGVSNYTVDMYLGYADSTQLDHYGNDYYLPSAISIDSFATVKVVSDYHLSVTHNGWFYIPFDTLFTVQPADPNKRLVVTVVSTTNSLETSSNSWRAKSDYNTSPYAYKARYAYSSTTPINPSSASGYSTSSVPNIKFFGNCAAGCVAPSANVATSTGNSIDVQIFANGEETSWQVEYKLPADTVWTLAGTATASPYTLTGLASSTAYQIRVGAICTDTVIFGASFTAATACVAVIPPYSVTLTTDNPCWTASGSPSSTNGYDIYSSNYLISPEMGVSLDTLAITITAQAYYQSGSTDLQVMACDADGSNTVAIDTIHTVYGSFNDYTVYVMNYTGTQNHFVIKAANSGDVYVKAVSIEYLPSCMPVSNVVADSVSPTTLSLSWATHSPASGYAVVYRLEGETAWDTMTVTTNNATLTGLTASSQYEVKVLTLCNDNTTMSTAVQLFNTECVPVNVPYNVFSFYSLPACWSTYTTGHPSTTWEESVPNSYGYIYSEATSSNNSANDWLISPAIIIPTTAAADSVMLVYEIAGVTDSWYSNSRALYHVYLAPNAGTAVADFTDTLLVDTLNSNVFSFRRISMSQYAGDTVRIAIRNASTYNGEIAVADFAVRSVLNPLYYIQGERDVFTDEEAGYKGVYLEGDTSDMTFTWTSTMAAAGNAVMTGETTDSITLVYSAPGRDTIVFVASNSYGNDTSRAYVNVIHCGVISSFPYIEDFETGNFACWRQEGDGEWELGAGDATNDDPHSGEYNALITHDDRGYVTKLISPVLNLGGNTAKMSFWHTQPVYAGDQDELRVYYRTSDESAWQLLAAYTNNISTWTQDSVILPNVTGTYQIAFEMTDDWGYGVGIDDIIINGVPGSDCEAPVIDSVVMGETTAQLFFTSEVGNYEVAIVPGEWQAPTTGTIITATNYTFTGLTAETQYTVGVRSLCDDDVTSTWVTRSVTTDEHPCLMPTGVELVSNTLTSAVIDWTPAEAAHSRWAVKVTGAGFNSLDTVNTHPYTVNGLTANTDYSVQVMTICSDERGSEFTEAMTFVTIDCQTVTGVNVSNVTSSTAVVSWDAVEGSTGRYEVNYGTAGFPQGSGSMVDVTSGTTVTLTGLDDDAMYDVYVRTYCAENVHSLWSAVYHFSTLENGIDDVTGANIALYPNPAHSTVTLTGIEGEATVTVVDMNGRVISETRSENGKLTLDVSGMAQGAYFVRITGEQVNAIRKLIVR